LTSPQDFSDAFSARDRQAAVEYLAHQDPLGARLLGHRLVSRELAAKVACQSTERLGIIPKAVKRPQRRITLGPHLGAPVTPAQPG
jgi:hypothetical protein